MRRILIAEASEVLVHLIKRDCLTADDAVQFCADGITAQGMLQEFKPDILLINMFLPYRNGLEILEEAAYLPPHIVALTYLADPYTLRIMRNLGVQSILHMPTSRSIGWALENAEKTSAGIRPDLRQKVTAHLRRLGLSSELEGYKMLLVGLPIFYADPAQSLGKELYPAIADILGKSSPQAVEKAIRDVITKAWAHRDDSVWEQYFSRNGKGRIADPPNKKFLLALVCRLQQEMETQERINENG